MLALSSGNSFYFLQGKGRIESQSPVMVKAFVLRLRFLFFGSSENGFLGDPRVSRPRSFNAWSFMFHTKDREN